MKWVPIALVLLAAACGSKTKKETLPDGTASRSRDHREKKQAMNEEKKQPDRQDEGDWNRDPSFGPIYFDFDSATLRPEARDTLERLADYMKQNPGVTVVISGHADERGTEEYNIALGEERARAARDYLKRLGVDVARVRVISYGETRPAVQGSDEGAWSRNRRDEFELSGTGRTATR